MNKYASILKSQWSQACPQMVESLNDPEMYFRLMGEEAATQVAELSNALAGPDVPGESYLQKVGRLNMARLQAEERVLAELRPPSNMSPEEPEDYDQWPREQQEAWIRESYKDDQAEMEIELARHFEEWKTIDRIMKRPTEDELETS